MNTEGDLECTCDIGVFATCPVCDEMNLLRYRNTKPEKPKTPQKKQGFMSPLDMWNYAQQSKTER